MLSSSHWPPAGAAAAFSLVFLLLSSSTVHRPPHVRTSLLSSEHTLPATCTLWPLFSSLDYSNRQSPQRTVSERFRMEQQAIFGFLGELQIENYRARDEDVDVWILQFLEGPRDETNLYDCLSDDLPPCPLPDANAYAVNFCRHKTERRRTGPRGTRKRRTSPWNPMFFGRHVRREYTSRKNNSRWTEEEIERLVQGVAKFGVGRWTMIKQKLFKTPSIRTAVNIKDKWRNLVNAYKEGSQKTAQLRLDPSLVAMIRKLAGKKPYANKKKRQEQSRTH